MISNPFLNLLNCIMNSHNKCINVFELNSHIKTNTADVPISSTFYSKLSLSKIPKAQKKTVKSLAFFTLLGSVCVKASRKHVCEIDPRWGTTFSIASINHGP